MPVPPCRLDIRAVVDRLRMSKDTQSDLPALLRKNRVVSHQKLCNRQSKAEPLGNDGMEYQHGPAILRRATGAGEIKQRKTSKGSPERRPVISFESAPIILNGWDAELKKGPQVQKVDIFRQVRIHTTIS